MENIKNNLLFVCVLVLAIVLCAPTIIKAEDNGQNRNGRDNNNQISNDLENQNENSLDSATPSNDESIKNNNKSNDNGELNGQEHRSRVANFVKSLSDIADKNGGMIGEAVRAVAKEQEDNKDNIANAIDKIKNRSGLKTFFIGTDYKNVGQLRSETVRTENQIKRLETLLETTSDATVKTGLQAQIDTLKAQEKKISDFVKTNENKFSLFGWFVKLFNR